MLFREDQENHLDSGKHLIVGLGNPGRSHRRNRHNIGFLAVDRLAEQHEIVLSRVKQRAVIGTGMVGSRPIILAKPQTYMNLSGDSVGPLASYYDIELARILVIYDEIDLALGTLRLREKGGSGGHNGMKSIISRLGHDFPRLRLGVGRPPGRMEPSRYVLRDFDKVELPIVDEMLVRAVGAVESWLSDGIDLAMTRYNGPVPEVDG